MIFRASASQPTTSSLEEPGATLTLRRPSEPSSRCPTISSVFAFAGDSKNDSKDDSHPARRSRQEVAPKNPLGAENTCRSGTCDLCGFVLASAKGAEFTRLGFEPRQREPKSLVLPLHHRVRLESQHSRRVERGARPAVAAPAVRVAWQYAAKAVVPGPDPRRPVKKATLVSAARCKMRDRIRLVSF